MVTHVELQSSMHALPSKLAAKQWQCLQESWECNDDNAIRLFAIPPVTGSEGKLSSYSSRQLRNVRITVSTKVQLLRIRFGTVLGKMRAVFVAMRGVNVGIGAAGTLDHRSESYVRQPRFEWERVVRMLTAQKDFTR